MSSGNNTSSGFLNTIAPLAFLLVLNILGFGLMYRNFPPRAGLFLAEIAVISMTVIYIFVAKPLSALTGGGPAGPGARYPADLTKTLEVAARLDQLVGDIEELKRSGGGPSKGLLDQVNARFSELASEIEQLKLGGGSADVGEVMQTLEGRFSQMMAEIDAVRQSGGSVDVEDIRQEMDARIGRLTAEVEHAKAGTGGVDVDDIRGDMEARLDELKEQITSLRQSGGVAEVDEIKEQLATIQFTQASAALTGQDRVDRLARRLSALQRLPDEVARLAEGQRTAQSERQKVSAAARELEEQIAALGTRLDQMATAERLQTMVAAVREDFAILEGRLDERALASDVRALSENLEPQLHALQKLVIELQDPAPLKALTSDIEAVQKRIGDLATSANVVNLANQMQERLDELRALVTEKDQTEAVEQLQNRLAEDVQGLRDELAGAARTEDLQRSVAEIEERIGEVTARLDGFTAGEFREQTAQVQDALAELKQALSHRATDEDVQEIAADLQSTIVRHVKGIEDSLGIASDARDGLSGSLTDLQEKVAALGEATQDIPDLWSRLQEMTTTEQAREWLGELREKIDTVEVRLEDVALSSDLTALSQDLAPQIQALQRLFVELQDPTRFKDMAAQIDEIKSKLEHAVSESRVDAVAEELREQLGKLDSALDAKASTDTVAEIQSAFRQDVDDLKARLERAAMADDLSKQLDRLDSAIEQRAPADRVEEIRAALRQDLGDLKARLDGAAMAQDMENELARIDAALEGKAPLDRVEDIRAALRQDVDDLKARLEGAAMAQELHEEFTRIDDALEEKAPAEQVDEVRATLRQDLNDLKARLEGAAMAQDLQKEIARIDAAVEGKAPVDRMEEIRAALKQDVDAVKSRLEGAAMAQNLRDELAKIDGLLKEKAPADLVEEIRKALKQDVDDLKARLEQAAMAQDLREQIARIDGLLKEKAPADRVEQAQAALKEDLDGVKSRLERVAMAEDLREQIAKLDSALQGKAPANALEEIRTNLKQDMADVKGRLERTATNDEVTRLVQDVKGQVEDLAGRLGGFTARELDAQLTGLRDRTEKLEKSLSLRATGEEVQYVASDLRSEISRQLRRLEKELAAESQTREALSGYVTALRERLAELAEVNEEIADVRARLDETATASAVKDHVAQLRDGLDAMERRLQDAAQSADLKDLSEELKPAVESLRGAVAEIQKSTRLDDLSGEVSRITARLGEMAVSSDLDRATDDFTGRLTELQRALGEQDQTEAVAQLRATVAEELQAVREELAQAATRAQVEELGSALRAKVEALSARLGKLTAEELEQRLSELGSDMARLKEALTTTAKAERVREMIDETRSGLSAELARIEEHVSSETETRKDLSGDVTKLHERLAVVSEAAAKVEDLSDKVSELGASEETHAEMQADKVGVLERVIEDLRARLAGVADRVEAMTAEQLGEALTEIRGELAEVKAAVSSVSQAAETIPALEARFEETASIERVQGWIGDLRSKLTHLEERLRDAARAADVGALSDEVKADLESLRRAVTRIEESTDLEKLAGEVAHIKERMSGLAASSDLEAAAREVKEQIADLKRLIDAQDPSEAIDALRGKVHEALEKLEALEAKLREAASASDVKSLTDEIGPEMKSLRAAVSDMQASTKLSDLAGELARIKEQVAASAASTDVKAVAREVDRQIDDLKRQLERKASAEVVELLQTKIDEHRDRVREKLAAAANRDDVEETAADMEARVERLSARLDEFTTEELEHGVADLKADIDKMKDVVSSLSKAAEEVSDLQTRLEETASVDRVQSWIGEVREKLEAAEEKWEQAALASDVRALGEQVKPELASLHEAVQKLQDSTRLDTVAAEVDRINGRLRDLAAQNDVESLVGGVRSRVEDLSNRLDGLGTAELEEGIAGLRADLGKVKDRVASMSGAAEEVSALQERLAETASADRVQSWIGKVRERLEEAEGKWRQAAEAADLRSLSDEVKPELVSLREAVRKLQESPRVDSLAAEVDRIGGRLRELASRSDVEALVEELKSQSEGLASRLDSFTTTGLEEGIAELQAELEKMKRVVAAMNGAAEEVAALQARLEETASVDRVQSWISEVREKLEMAEARWQDAAGASDLRELSAELKPELDALREAVRALQESPRLDTLEADMERITGRLNDVAALSDVESMVEDVRSQVTGLSARLDGLGTEALERGISDLQADVDKMKEVVDSAGRAAEEITTLQARLEETASVDRVQSWLDDVRDKLGDLEARIHDAASLSDVESVRDELKPELESLRATVLDVQDTSKIDTLSGVVVGLRDQLVGLAASGDVDDLADRVKQQIDKLKKRIEEADPAQAIAELQARIDEDRDRVAEELARATDRRGVEESLAGIRARLDELTARLDTVTTEELEQNLSELRSEVDKMKAMVSSAEDAAEEITALRAQLEETASVDRVQSWISDVRERLEAVEERMQDTAARADVSALEERLGPELERLQQTVTGVVDAARLDEMAGDVSGVKERFDELRERLEDLDAARSTHERRIESVEAMFGEEIDAVRRDLEKTAGAEQVERLLAEIEGRVGELAGRLEGLLSEGLAPTRPVDDLPAADTPEDVLNRLAKLEEGIARAGEITDEVQLLWERLAEIKYDLAPDARGATGPEFDHVVDGLREEIADLSRRLEAAGGPAPSADLSRLEAEIEELRQTVASAGGEEAERPVSGAQSEIEAQLERVEQQLAAEREAREDLSEGLSQLRDDIARAAQAAEEVAATEPPEEEISPTDRAHEWLCELREKLERVEDRLQDLAPAAALGSLAEELRPKVESLEETVAGMQTSPTLMELSHDVAKIKERLSGMTTETGEAQPAAPDVREQLGELAAQLGEFKADELEDRLSGLKGEIGELRKLLATAPSSEDVQHLIAEKHAAIAAELERIEAALTAERDAREGLSGDLSELREKLSVVAETEEEVAALRGRLNEMASLDHVAESVDKVREELDRVRDRLAGLASAVDVDAIAEDLKKQLADLRERCESADEAHAGTIERIDALEAMVREQFDSVSKALDGAATAENMDDFVADIEGRLGDLSGRLEGLLAKGLTERMADLGREFEVVKEAAAAGLSREDVSNLVTGKQANIWKKLKRLEEDLAAVPQAAGKVDELSDKLAALSDRLDQFTTEELERGLGDLRDDIERMKHSVASVSGAAAEVSALRDRLEETASVDRVQSWIGEVRDKLETLEQTVQEAARASDVRALSDELKPEIASLQRAMTELGESEKIEALSGEVDHVKEQLEQLRTLLDQADAAQSTDALRIESIEAMVGEQLDAIRKDLEGAAKADRLEEVIAEMEGRLGELSGRLEGLLAEGVEQRLATVRDELDGLKEAIASLPAGEELRGPAMDRYAELAEKVARLQEDLGAESDARASLVGDVGELRESVSALSDIGEEVEQLWARVAELKWDLGPPQGAGQWGGASDELIGAEEPEPAAPAEGPPVFRPAPEESRQPTLVDEPIPQPVEPAPPPIVEEEAGAEEAEFEETKIMPFPGEDESGMERVLHRSDPLVQPLSDRYTAAVDALDELLVGIREGRADADPVRTWATAQALVSAMEENARILLGLASQPYQDKRIANHSVNVLLLTLRAAEVMNVSGEEKQTLAQAALFHDIGMMRLPPEILERTKELSKEDEEALKRYPEYGAELLGVFENDLLCTVVSQCHEREDGNGFPAGLQGPDIHAFAKIVRVADVYDAVVRAQGQGRCLRPFEAMKMLQKDVGASFNADAFRQFREAVGAFPVGTIVQLSTREQAKVIDMQPRKILQPTVAVVTDTDGKLLSQSRFLSLAQNPGVFIERAVVDDDLQAKTRDLM